ncbi:hypothetical protein AB6D85_13145 [Vibrio splendidus]
MEELEQSNSVEAELSNFPYGSCEATSQMLALFLESRGIERVTYTRNEWGGYIHYWVFVNNETLIDLTAHQFPDCNNEFIVTERSIFHDKFKCLESFPPNLESLNRFGSRYGYKPCYYSILRRAKNT